MNHAQLNEKIIVDSAGTSDWHIGKPPDKRSQAAALEEGYDMSGLRARQLSARDFLVFDYILAMDKDNLDVIREQCPDSYRGVCGLFLTEAGIESVTEVPDPYYGDHSHFTRVIELIGQGSDDLLARIRHDHHL